MTTQSGRVLMVGCGHMGSAIARGLLGVTPSPELVIVERSAERRAALSAVDGLTVTADLEIVDGDFVVVAIPPQDFDAFAEAQRHHFGPRTPVLSVMAGLTCDSIATALGTTQVVRSIPNTPSEVFEGMTIYYADSQVSERTLVQVDQLLKAIGKSLRVDAEHLVDDATAICGGGPAFVSYIVDAFCRFAVSCGFSEAAGRVMVAQVFGGTAALIEQGGKPPMQLCREVMTPNGTTERGIAAFDAAGLHDSILAALTASAERSRELALSASERGPR
ncbi:MAG: pyrroline-5-carboxylate reductase [Angustibacter sp.]